MAVAGGNTLLDRPRAFRVELEEFVIIVRLDEEGGEPVEVVDHVRGDVTRIGEEPETQAAAVDDESDGIDRIVLDREGLDGEMIDRKRLAGLEGFPCGLADVLLADDVGRLRRRVYGHRVFLKEIFQTPDVIAVFMREQDPGKRCGIDAK